jgi:two-component system response regulator AtoC
MRAAVLSQGDLLLEEHLVGDGVARRDSDRDGLPRADPGQIETLEQVERAHIERVFALTKGHRGRTCHILGISRPTLERKLRKYGMSGTSDD